MTSIKIKRCPKGTRKNKTTGKCEKRKRREIKKLVIKPSSAKKTQTKKCPPHKPLYNPKTNRCVLDTLANREKIKNINLKQNEKREDLVPVVKNKIQKRTNKNLLKTSLDTYDAWNCDKSIFKDIDLNKIKSINDVKNGTYQLYYLDENNKKIYLNKKQFIAGGSFGNVYRIYDKDEKINVALKTYNNPNNKARRI